MKNSFLILVAIFTLSVSAQKLDKSSGFDKLKGDFTLLSMKNGNTALLEITKKEGINFKIYDTLRKKVSSKLKSKLLEDKIGYYEQQAFFEADGDLVLFLKLMDERTPWLLRMIIDGKTAKLKSELKIDSLPRVARGSGYAMAFGGVDIPDFIISKDEHSDYYAIINYNTLTSETSQRIDVKHYNPQHELINRSYYNTPLKNYKFTKYLDACVNKDNYVILAIYAYNNEKENGAKPEYFIAKLNKGKSEFKQVSLPNANAEKMGSLEFIYNKQKDVVHIFRTTFLESRRKKSYYDFVIHNIKPNDLSLGVTFSPDFKQVNKYYRDQMDRDDDYAGILKKIAVNPAGNLVLFYQEKEIFTKSDGKTSTTKIYYGDVALFVLSSEGKLLNSAVFPYNVLSTGQYELLMKMVNTEKATYVLCNNTLPNIEKEETREAKPLKALGQCISVKYVLENNSVKSYFILKPPLKEKGNPFFDFGHATFNQYTKTVAAVHFDPETKKNMLVWIKLD